MEFPLKMTLARGSTAAGMVIEIRTVHFPAEGVAVDAHRVGGSGSVAVALLEHLADKALLEFADCVFVGNATLNELADQ